MTLPRCFFQWRLTCLPVEKIISYFCTSPRNQILKLHLLMLSHLIGRSLRMPTLFSIMSDQPLSSESSSRRGYSGNDCSNVGNPSLVFQPAEFFNQQPARVSCYQRCAIQPLFTEFRPSSPKSYLMACKLSGFTFLTKTFLRRLPTSCVPWSQVHNDYTMFTFRDGPTLARWDKWIHSLPLWRIFSVFSILYIDKSCLFYP